MRRIKNYIYADKEWPNFTWDSKAIITILSRVRNKQDLVFLCHLFGLLTGKMKAPDIDDFENLLNRMKDDGLLTLSNINKYKEIFGLDPGFPNDLVIVNNSY